MEKITNSKQTIPKKKILLISGYDASSHRYWRKILQSELAQYDWTQVALPDRYYAWRIRGNSLTLANQYSVELNADYDCLLVTSMVDLNSLRGFIPKLAKLPTILYCHENQFDYPSNAQPQEFANRLNAQLSAIYSMKCADKILFNSLHNHSSFYKGAKKLFKKLPDGVSVSEIDDLEAKSSVLPVPIKVAEKNITLAKVSKGLQKESGNHSAFSIVWNHRWEFDKQPEVLFAALRLVVKQKLNFRLHVLGQSFRNVPKCFSAAKLEFADYIDNWGFQPRDQYDRILVESDIVVSTASHDFQGLSMLEAINFGCIPVAPNRVAYPEYIDKELLYDTSGHSCEAQELALKLEWIIGNWNEVAGNRSLKFRQLAKRYRSGYLIPEYQKHIENILR